MEVAAQRVLSTDAQALVAGAIFFLFVYLPGLLLWAFLTNPNDDPLEPSPVTDSSAAPPPEAHHR